METWSVALRKVLSRIDRSSTKGFVQASLSFKCQVFLPRRKTLWIIEDKHFLGMRTEWEMYLYLCMYSLASATWLMGEFILRIVTRFWWLFDVATNFGKFSLSSIAHCQQSPATLPLSLTPFVQLGLLHSNEKLLFWFPKHLSKGRVSRCVIFSSFVWIPGFLTLLEAMHCGNWSRASSRLTDVPKDINNKLTEVSLEDNAIMIARSFAFCKAENLECLNLRKNKISEIQQNLSFKYAKVISGRKQTLMFAQIQFCWPP